jgi:hypothetical protein
MIASVRINLPAITFDWISRIALCKMRRSVESAQEWVQVKPNDFLSNLRRGKLGLRYD